MLGDAPGSDTAGLTPGAAAAVVVVEAGEDVDVDGSAGPAVAGFTVDPTVGNGNGTPKIGLTGRGTVTAGPLTVVPGGEVTAAVVTVVSDDSGVVVVTTVVAVVTGGRVVVVVGAAVVVVVGGAVVVVGGAVVVVVRGGAVVVVVVDVVVVLGGLVVVVDDEGGGVMAWGTTAAVACANAGDSSHDKAVSSAAVSAMRTVDTIALAPLHCPWPCLVGTNGTARPPSAALGSISLRPPMWLLRSSLSLPALEVAAQGVLRRRAVI